jgi:DNA-binding PadR family transcriptional regulator
VLDLAILGLLNEQPLHGYELRKRLGESLGSMWGISYGSLYPALRRLEREGDIEIVEPGFTTAPIPATGSLDGDRAAARQRHMGKPSRRTRKAYRITDRGLQHLDELLLADDASDDERTFALKLVFCGHLEPAARVALLERRRAVLTAHLVRSRRPGSGRGDRYSRSLFEHRTQSTERDLEWIEALIAAELRDGADDNRTANGRTRGATAS